MFNYQNTNQYFAQIAGGMETLGSTEIGELGADKIRPVYRGLFFEADKKTLYNLNYQSRLLSRILAPLISFNCRDTDELYRQAGTLDWSQIMKPEQTFAVIANVSNSWITHSQYAGLRVKDAIVDHFKTKVNRRPNIDTQNPDFWINLHIENNRATISLDASGSALHRRGYRRESVLAPMQETLAAAIIRLSEWDGAVPLIDPMCGSGTLICEALMAYCRIPAGYFRTRFGFELFPDFDAAVWQEVQETARREMRDLPRNLLEASDKSPQALLKTRKNLLEIPSSKQVQLKTRKYQGILELRNSVIVCNPPYGIRLNKKEDLTLFYKEFGDFLKQRCTGCTAYIYFGERKYIRNIGLKPSWKMPLPNGALDGRLVKFELY